MAGVGGKGPCFPAVSAMISRHCRWWGTAEGTADVLPDWTLGWAGLGLVLEERVFIFLTPLIINFYDSPISPLENQNFNPF